MDAHRTTTRLQGAGAAAALLAGLLAVGWAAAISPDFPFLPPGGEGAWIRAPAAVRAGEQVTPREDVPPTAFRRRFRAPQPGADLRLEVRALRSFVVILNGRELARQEAGRGSWKRLTRVDVPGRRVREENLLEVRVRHDRGPPLLQLAVRGPGVRLATSPSSGWEVVGPEGVPTQAVRADDTARGAMGLAAPTVGDVLRAHGSALAGLLVALGMLSWATADLRRRLPVRWGLVLTGLLVAGVWTGLLVHSLSLPAFAGFDGPDHLAYVRHLLARRELPLATDGPAMYHPPLYYALAAGLSALGDAGSEPPRWALALVPWLAGLGQVAVAYRLGRLLLPGGRGPAAAAAVAAALLPMNLYMSGYVSNEPLHALLAGASLLLGVELLLAPALPPGRLAALGVALGLALLAKMTALLLVPLLAIFLAAKHRVADGASPGRVVARAGAVLAIAALVGGWFYARNWLRLGRPFVGNWEVPGASHHWWLQPGFHTPAYYLGFGESLRRPFFAGFHSFWDGIYSTLFGDGLLGGVRAFSVRLPVWDHEAMTLACLVALPAALLIAWGLASAAACAVRSPDLRRRWALSLVVAAVGAYGFAVLFMTLRLPFYAQAKAFYALALTAPLATLFVRGFLAARRRARALAGDAGEAVLHAWAGTLALLVTRAFAFG